MTIQNSVGHMMRHPLREHLGRHELAQRGPTELEMPSYLRDRHPLRLETADGFVARLPTGTAGLTCGLFTRRELAEALSWGRGDPLGLARFGERWQW